MDDPAKILSVESCRDVKYIPYVKHSISPGRLYYYSKQIHVLRGAAQQEGRRIYACVGSVRILRLLPTIQRHARQTTWQL